MKKLLVIFLGLLMIMSCSTETKITDYTITIDKGIIHGSIIADKNKAAEGEKVTLTVLPDDAYVLESLRVTDSNSNVIKVTNNSFIMPKDNVFIRANFKSEYYSIYIPNIITNGSIKTDKLSAKEGETVNLIITPDKGAVLGKIEVITVDGSLVSVSEKQDSKSFTMPSQDVSIRVKFYVLPTSPLISLASGTDGTLGPTGTYVTFGSWPQSLKSKNVKVNEAENIIVGDFTYYLGSDNCWYVKAVCKGWHHKTQQFISKQEFDDKIPQYYKVEPIKWRLITTKYNNGSSSGKRMILAENILFVSPFYDNNEIRTINGETIYPNNYEYSRVRAFLNGLSYITKDSDSSSQMNNEDFEGKGFLYTAFNENERNLIANTKVIDNTENALPMDYNSLSDIYKNQWAYGENLYTSGSSFYDKIFLLSVRDLTSTEYGFLGYEAIPMCSTRRLEPTIFAETIGSCYYSPYSPEDEWYDYGQWWLRSPSHYDYSKNKPGTWVNAIYRHGGPPSWDRTSYAYNKNYGIVLALCLE